MNESETTIELIADENVTNTTQSESETVNVFEIGYAENYDDQQKGEILLEEDAGEEIEDNEEEEEGHHYFITTDGDAKDNDLSTAEFVIEKCDEKSQEYEIRQKTVDEPRIESSRVQMAPSTSENTNQCVGNFEPLDADEKFLLSCAPAMRVRFLKYLKTLTTKFLIYTEND